MISDTIVIIILWFTLMMILYIGAAYDPIIISQ